MKLKLLFIPVLMVYQVSLFGQPGELDTLQSYFDEMPDDTAKIKTLSMTAYDLFRDHPDVAIKFGKQALGLSLRLNSEEGRASTTNHLGSAFMTLSQYDSASYYYNLSLQLYRDIGPVKKQASLLNNLGHLERVKGNFESSAAYLLEALELNTSIGNDKGRASNYLNLGIVLSRLKRYKEAHDYNLKAIELSSADDHATLGNIYNNISIDFRVLKEYDSAKYYLKKSIHHRKMLDSKNALAGSYSNLGILYYYLGKPDSTLVLFKEVLNTYISIGNRKEISRSYFNIAELYRMQNSYKKADIHLVKSYEEAKIAQSKEQIRDALLGLAKVNASLRKFEKAYSYRIEYESYKDSISNEKNINHINELVSKYEAERKDKQITELELEKRTASLALTRSSNERNILIAFVAILSIGALLLFIFFRQKRRSLAEKELLLKEIHHRVKNNLQVISSLLNLQSESLESEVAKEAVKEGQHRVKSMALIHQKLYSTEDVRGVDVQDYLENLSAELFRAFGLDQDKVAFEVMTSGLKLDIDTVIPLGLIVNELITNAIKYAFQDMENGLLRIEMAEQGANLSVLVQDNGKGMDEKALESTNSFGWKMIKSLCRKLKAEISVQSVGGTQVRLILTNYKLIT